MQRHITITIALLFFFPLFLFSDVFIAISDGEWSDPSVWDRGTVPGEADDVYIKGHAVYVGGSSSGIIINSLFVENKQGKGVSSLNLEGQVNFTINNDLTVVANNIDKDVEIQVFGGAVLKVSGNATFIRTRDNQQPAMLRLNVQSQSTVQIEGRLTFDYNSGAAGEETEEIFLNDQARLEIGEDLLLYMRGGQDLNFDLFNNSIVSIGGKMNAHLLGGQKFFFNLDSSSGFSLEGNAEFLLNGGEEFMNLNILGSWEVRGDLSMRTYSMGKPLSLVADGTTAILDVDGDIIMSAAGPGDLRLSLQTDAMLYLGGNFLRPDSYGSLVMSQQATLVLDGASAQRIPQDALPGAEGDQFAITNILFDNRSGQPLTLTGPMTVGDELELSEGIIRIEDGGSITLTDGAIVSGGSPQAYIDGPVTKIGSTGSDYFVFPTGSGAVYAPLEISALTDPNDSYTVQYRDDPPPIEENLKAPAARLNGQGYWSVSRTPGSTIPDFTLYWSDAETRGIDDMDKIIVAFVDTTSGSQTPEWTSLGRSRTTGSTGSGISGSVTQSLDDPPPIEEEGFITIGFTGSTFNSTISALSVNPQLAPPVLVNFNAQRRQDAVKVVWEMDKAASNHHFMIERSGSEGIFEMIGNLQGQGNSESIRHYVFDDLQPIPGPNYYRLRMVDAAGNQELSGTIMIFFENTGKACLFPNPVTDQIRVFSGRELNEPAQVEVVDQLGRILFSGPLNLENGQLTLSVAELNIRRDGIYFLKMKCASGMRRVFRFTKAE